MSSILSWSGLNTFCSGSVYISSDILCWETQTCCTMFYVPNISSSRPWTKAPQAPEAIRFTVFVSSLSLGASSAHFLPEENSPEVKSSLARSWAVRFLWTQKRRVRGGVLINNIRSAYPTHRQIYCRFLFCILTLRSDISFLSKVCSRKWGLTCSIEPWDTRHFPLQIWYLT